MTIIIKFLWEENHALCKKFPYEAASIDTEGKYQY